MSLNRVYTDWMIVNALLIEHIMKAKSVDGRDWIIKKKKSIILWQQKIPQSDLMATKPQ